MRQNRYILLALLLVTSVSCASATVDGHPRLLISKQDVSLMSEASSMPASFEAAVNQAKSKVDRYLTQMPDVPLPVDAGGGYSHEQHKRNSTTIQDAGVLYQMTGNNAYAELAKDILLAYADMYPTLGDHPQKKNQSPGKLFWQSLNEAVWLVVSIQGYDAIYDALTDAERTKIEGQLLRPMVSFISDQAPQTFDRIHNHGTWAVAAVGMTGYVLDDKEYVEKALYGLKRDGSAGFMKQIDLLFSPDGYYSEGPYYQRYALLPFVLFAQAIERNEPKRGIFRHRDGILLKAVNTTIQLSYNGLFFPINDAIKDKGIDTTELVYGVLRNRRLLDHALSHHVKRPLARVQPEVLDCLRLAAYQILLLDRIPEYAAVDDAVGSVRRHKGRALSGFVNAVLRKLKRRDLNRGMPADPVRRLALARSLPEEIARSWTSQLGYQEADRR